MSTDQFEKKSQITELEKELLNAFKNKDLQTLDKLIHADALFVLPNGKTVTKSMVLDNYRGGDTVMTEIISTDQLVHFIDDTAVVSINLELKGTYFDQVISSQFRYIRVWKLISTAWKVIAVSGVPINNPL